MPSSPLPVRESSDHPPASKSLLPFAVFMAVMAFIWSSLATGSGTGALRLLGFAGMAAAVIIPVIGLIRGRPVDSGSATSPRHRPVCTSPGRLFAAGVVAEVALIAVALVLLRLLDSSEAAVPVIAVVVGAHFVIFYLLQGARLHLWATVGGISSGVIPLALAASGVVAPEDASALTGLGMGAVTTTYAWVFARTVRRTA